MRVLNTKGFNPELAFEALKVLGMEMEFLFIEKFYKSIGAEEKSKQPSNSQALSDINVHCDVCGTIMVRSGTCYKCLNCGASLSCL